MVRPPEPRRAPRAALKALLLLGLLCAAWKPESPQDRAVELLASLTAKTSAKRADSTSYVVIPSPAGNLRGRLYAAATPSLRRALVLAHGVHHRGIDEPRLNRFAEHLSRLGFAVLVPELPGLASYRVDAASLQGIEAAVRFLSERDDLAPSGKVGLFGISFGGGLALVAAEQPDVCQRLEYVTSLGGHHDLYRVLRFYLTNEIESPRGAEALDAHEYGVALLVLGELEALAPVVDRALLRESFRDYIAENREGAKATASKLRTAEARALFDDLQNHRLSSLAPLLLPLLEKRREELSKLSPGGSLSDICVPVNLLHGKTDRVIPATELQWADAELAGRPHQALATSLIEHVDPDRPAGIFEKLALVEFVAQML